MRRFLLLIVLLSWPALASAQALSCHADGPIAPPVADREAQTAPHRGVPIIGYTLALIWAPEYCRTRTQSARDAFECGGANRFGFVLHGLWPDGRGDQWPQYCRPVGLLPTALVRRNLCAAPSAQLQQHEWAKHGSCTGRDPARYFADATGLYSRMRFPDMDAASRRSQTAGGLARAIATGSGLAEGSVRVVANRRGWLEEVRVCLDKAEHAIACPADAHGQFSGSQPMKIWRGGAARSSRSPGGAYRASGG